MEIIPLKEYSICLFLIRFLPHFTEEILTLTYIQYLAFTRLGIIIILCMELNPVIVTNS